jgi:PAS domain S-box-containing protein
MGRGRVRGRTVRPSSPPPDRTGAASVHELLEILARDLRLDDESVRRRLAFLRLTEGDLARLRTLHALLADYAEPFSRAFYDHLLAFDETARFLPDAEAVERLRQSQARYFQTLTVGAYDLAYARDRLRIGIAHQRIGLSTAWYLGAYSWYLAELLPEVWRRLGGQPEQFVATITSLIKIILLDMGLAVDAYVTSDRRMISSLQAYSDAAITNLPFGVLVLGSNLRVRFANPSALHWLGLSPGAVRDRPLVELIPIGGLGALAQKALEGGTGLVVQGTVPIGGRRPVRVTLSGIPLADGSGVLAVIEDLSAQAALEDRIWLSEEQFASAFEYAAIGMALVAPDGRWLKVNRSLCELTGYEEAELLQLTFQDITHPDDLATDLDYVRQMLEGRIRTYQMEKRYFTRTGGSSGCC